MRTIILFLLLALCLTVLPPRPAAAAELCFPEQPAITNCLAAEFVPFWQSNGGLPVFGYPIGPAGVDPVTGLLTQWTERARLELHPDNPAGYRVLLGRLGADWLVQAGRDAAALPREEGPRAGCRWFAETSINVCNQDGNQGFRRYWESNGLRIAGLNAYQQSLALFGLPLGPAQVETGSDGREYLVQWFERARFEWHPENPPESRVLLGLLARELQGQVAPARFRTSIVGVEVNTSMVGAVAGRIGEAEAGWVRYNGINWAEIEPEIGERRWERLAGVEAELQAISSQGARPIVIVRGTPAWAQQVPGSQCGPIKPEHYDRFALFVAELAARYGGPPYNVRHWEILNEPDAPIVAGESVFGCWGNPNDPYFGGGAYANMLKVVHTRLKTVDPQARLLMGGLLMDCDPTRDESCRAGRFFEGMLRTGSAPFDIANYHAYTYWGNPDGDWELMHPKWDHRGGVLLGKLQFMRETMARYGVDRPVMMSEGGLLCYRSDPSCSVPAMYNDQANYLLRLYSRSQANGLVGAIWYTLNGPGWQEGGLLDAAQQPRPAYQALRFAGPLFHNAQFVANLSTADYEAYAFARGNRQYQIYWMNRRSEMSIPLPAGAVAVYNHFGENLPLEGNLQIGFAPRIVELE